MRQRAMSNRSYDPFGWGRFPVGVRTVEALDTARNRRFPCEIWYPAATPHAGEDRDASALPGRYPLIVFSHSSGGNRRQAAFLCTHLSSHGYIVAAMDHSETIAPELRRKEGESAEQRAARIQGWIANRVPDIRLLLDRVLDAAWWDSQAMPDPDRIGIAGHSFGGWTALATPEIDGRIRAVVALAPAGSSNPPPGIIPATLTFTWGRDVPTLYLAAEDDTALPLAGMHELYERTAATKRMIVLRKADHAHFFDKFEPRTGQCPAEEAHLFTRSLTLCHFDASLQANVHAQHFLDADVDAELAARGVDAFSKGNP